MSPFYEMSGMISQNVFCKTYTNIYTHIYTYMQRELDI
jgi:hypothetical protein